MKDISPSDTLEIISACFDLLASRETEIKELYRKLQKHEPVEEPDIKVIHNITASLDDASETPDWPGAIAICGTPLVGRSLMLLCPQMGLRIAGITDSGIDGLALVERQRPKIVFIDLDIADIDGHVLVSRINDISHDIVVIALSAGDEETTLVSATIAGAREVISKPIQANRVIDTVKRILKQARHEKELLGKLPNAVNPTKPKISDGWTVI